MPHHQHVHYLELATPTNPLSSADIKSSLRLSPSSPTDPEPPSPLSQTPSPMDTAMSYAAWTREPTTFDVVFGLALPYRPPRSVVGTFLWRRRLWLETTFALSMMQPWEKIVVGCVVWTVLALMLAGMYLYLPQNFVYVCARTTYYLVGHEIGLPSTGLGEGGNTTGLGSLAIRLHDET